MELIIAYHKMKEINQKYTWVDFLWNLAIISWKIPIVEVKTPFYSVQPYILKCFFAQP